MSTLLKVLIAVVVGVVVAFIAGAILKHFGLDLFWGWLVGVIAGLIYFTSGPVLPVR